MTTLTWNSSDKSGDITLSNGDLTATCTAGGAWDSVRATESKGYGKWYWEVTVIEDVSAQDHLIGFGTSSFSLSSYCGSDANSYGYYGNGTIYNNGGSAAYGDTYNEGDIIGVALDLNDGKVYFSKNGVFQNSGDPVIGTNPAFSSIGGGFYFPAISLYQNTKSMTANFGASDFVYSVPTGYSALGFQGIFSGFVYENSVPLSGAKLYAYKRNSGSYSTSGVSADDGSYSLTVGVDTEHFIVCLDPSEPANYNDLIYGRVVPVESDIPIIYLIDDDFAGASLDTDIWTENTAPNASITVSDELQLNNITGANHSGAMVYSDDSWSVSGIFRLTCQWKPHTNHYAGVWPPGITFYGNLPGTRHANYGRIYYDCVSFELGTGGDTNNRTKIGIREFNSSGTQNLLQQTAINIDESQWHTVSIIFNADTGACTLDLNNGDYTCGTTMTGSVLTGFGANLKIELYSIDYNKNNTERFKDLLLWKV